MELPRSLVLNIEAFENILSLNRITNSYKFYWFSGLFREIRYGNKEMSFKTVVLWMIVESWYSIVEYKLDFGPQDKLQELVDFIYSSHNLKKDINPDELFSELELIIERDSQVRSKVQDLTKYVPYRLLTPFYDSELRGKKDYKKNKIIAKLSREKPTGVYKIRNNNLVIRDKWWEYIHKNQSIISGWLKHKLIYFLQTRNPNVPAIPFKLKAPKKRKLRMGKKFWKLVMEREGEIVDIYTDRIINPKAKISIDHFIPWSFVLHDKLWNLVPTFKNINSTKNNRLPDLEAYLDKFCELQYKGFNIALNNNFSKKSMEDYLDLNSKMSLSTNLPKDFFVSSVKENIRPLHQIASNQGFLKWKYS